MKIDLAKIIKTAAGPAFKSDVDDDGRACFRRSLQFCGCLP
jgi:hypothetical protein